jgi:hypothetical protein
MTNLFETLLNLLLEQDGKIMTLTRAISNKLPITIDYGGPIGEVLSGKRYDIQPIVMGKHITSGNLIIWAYVFKGVSKKGLPNWKMFRVDRIKTVNFKLGDKSFELGNIPGYIKDKAPNMMKSLQSVDVFSPYISDVAQKQTKTQPQKKAYIGGKPFDSIIGKKEITATEKEHVVRTIYYTLQDMWKNNQRAIVGGNVRPGERTRKRFQREAEIEMNDYMKKYNIKLVDNIEIDQTTDNDQDIDIKPDTNTNQDINNDQDINNIETINEIKKTFYRLVF